ncbi:hypothetical protein HMPREF9072_00864 [Capnocytophaga sp. oral taxon 324 str. F0483]|nr:hypothetical protein HMPREF9072_00864 [Capnocytophaga sp. oral taxon 324 str. F0483]
MQRYNNNKKYQYPNPSHSINPLISNFLYSLSLSYISLRFIFPPPHSH